MNHGISTLQPVHHVAQKSSSTTLPLSADSCTGLPSRPGNEKFVAGLRAAGFNSSAEVGIEVNASSAAASIAIFILNSPTRLPAYLPTRRSGGQFLQQRRRLFIHR